MIGLATALGEGHSPNLSSTKTTAISARTVVRDLENVLTGVATSRSLVEISIPLQLTQNQRQVKIALTHQLEDVRNTISVKVSKAKLVGRRAVISQCLTADCERVRFVIVKPPLEETVLPQRGEEKVGALIAVEIAVQANVMHA